MELYAKDFVSDFSLLLCQSFFNIFRSDKITIRFASQLKKRERDLLSGDSNKKSFIGNEIIIYHF